MNVIRALYDHYDNVDHPPLGYTYFSSAICIVINDDGDIVQCEDIRTKIEASSKKIPKKVLLPQTVGKGSATIPIILADGIDYLAGMGDPEKAKRSAKRHTASINAHKKLLKDIISFEPTKEELRAIEAVYRFICKSHPELVLDKESFENGGAYGYFCVFRLSGKLEFVHELEVVKRYVADRFHNNRDLAKKQPTGQCLVTGKVGPIMLTHNPTIKGLRGNAQASGAKLVSFNDEPTRFQGLDQSMNAPMSREAVWRYTSTLNWLIDKQRICINDLNVIFWSTDNCKEYDELLCACDNTRKESDDNLKSVMEYVESGKLPSGVDPNMQCCILGLVPARTRIAIKFWHTDTASGIFEKIRQHMLDMRVGSQWFPSIYQIIAACYDDNQGGKTDAQFVFAEPLFMSILYGQVYPRPLLYALVKRMQQNGCVNEYTKVISKLQTAVLRGICNRELRCNSKEEFEMSLNVDRPEPMYHWGRLFAICCHIQKANDPKVKRTLNHRFFKTAMTRPLVVFNEVMVLANHHLNKMECDKPGLAVYFRGLINGVIDKIDDPIKRTDRIDMTHFILGYSHQLTFLFTKKGEGVSDENSDEE